MFFPKVFGAFLVAFCCFQSGRTNLENPSGGGVLKGDSPVLAEQSAVSSSSLAEYAYLGAASGLSAADEANGISVDLGCLAFYQYQRSGRTYYVAYAPVLALSGGIYEIKVIDNSWNYEYKVHREEIQRASAYTLEVVKAGKASMEVDYFSLSESASETVVSASAPSQGASSDVQRWVDESANFSQPYESGLNSAGRSVQTLSDSSVRKGLRDPGVRKNSISNQTSNSLYDQYADTDSSILTYASSDAGKGGHQMAEGGDGTQIFVTDDNIVNIIPRSLLTTVGSYCFMGSEYGFYVNTYASGSDDTSNVLVFDIVNTIPVSFMGGEIMVRPVINGFVDYDKAYNVVHWDYGSSSNLAIGNVSATAGMGNVSHPNIGDSDYDKDNDYGYYLGSYCTSIHGVAENGDYNGLATPMASWALKLISFGVSQIPFHIGDAINLVWDIAYEAIDSAYTANLLSGHASLSPSLLADGSLTSNNVTLSNANYSTALSQWGRVPRTLGFGLSKTDGSAENATDPLLYKTSSHFFEMNYTTHQRSTDVNWDSYLASSISLNVFNDTTWSVLGLHFGSLDLEATISNNWVRVFNLESQPSTTAMFAGTAYYVQYCSSLIGGDDYGGSGNDYQEYSFTPTRSGTYLFQTYGTDFDTLLYLYDNSMNQLAYNDDGGYYLNSSSLRHCSLISYSLTAGSTYKIRVRGNNGLEGGTYLRADESGGTVSENGRGVTNPAVFTGVGTEEKCYLFSPAASGEYSVFTSKYSASVDTVMSVFDDAFNRICFNDDEGNGTGRFFSKAECYMTAGKTYYIFVRTFNGSASTTYQFRVNVIQHESLSNKGTDLENSFHETCHIQAGASTLYFSFVPSRSSVYSFWTYFISGCKDLTMRILDADLIQLAYDDDSAGNLQPEISSYSFSAYRQYYILIEKYNASNTDLTSFQLYCQ
jgi:hypothetical protein